MLDRLLPAAASEHAAAFDAVLSSIHLHMAVQAIAWGAFFLYCMFRFRHRGDPHPAVPPLKPALPVLAIALVIVGDAVLLTTAALPAWLSRTTLPDRSTTPLEIRVVAEQFAWNIHYPGPDGQFGEARDALISAGNPLGIDRASAHAADDIGLANILTVPVGRPTIVRLASRDVVHSFTLNEMRIRHDATPGAFTHTWFTPIQIGSWEIACSQLCGLGHYRMRGTFVVLSEPAWQQWQARELALVNQVRR